MTIALVKLWSTSPAGLTSVASSPPGTFPLENGKKRSWIHFKCRFDIAINDIEKWTNNLLPSRQFGKVVLTTSGGIMDHEEARRKHLVEKFWDSSSEIKTCVFTKVEARDTFTLSLQEIPVSLQCKTSGTLC